MNKAIPSLSTRGMVTGITDQVDLLLSYVMVANYSQSELYYSKITSFPYLVKMYGHDPREMAARTQSALTIMFERFFEGCLIDVSYEYLNANAGDGPYGLTIQITAINAQGQRINIASELEITEGKFKEIIRRNNEDTA